MTGASHSLRERDIGRTWALVQPVLPRVGVSRVTEVTQLDRLGVPVYASIRPRGQTLCVHAGKGRTAEQARLGASMEALELAVVEGSAPPPSSSLRMSLLGWLGACPPGLGLIDFAPDPLARFSPDQPVPVLAAEWLGNARPVPLPVALVHPMPDDDPAARLFPWTSTGLASGNTLAEATLHALLEVLERDTTALHEAQDGSELLPASEWPQPYGAWASAWARCGVELVVRHLPNEFGLPCFLACLHEPGSADVNLAEGTGLHLSAAEAFARAVEEAAQSRLSAIHGGRDDMVEYFAKYRMSRPERLAREAGYLQALQDPTRRTTWRRLPNHRPRGVGTALQGLLRRLKGLGFDWVLRARLRMPGLERLPVEVVKLVVPRCESSHSGVQRVGPRLMQRLRPHGEH